MNLLERASAYILKITFCFKKAKQTFYSKQIKISLIFELTSDIFEMKKKVGSTNVFEEFEDTTGVIRIRKSKTDRQHNGQNKKDKQRSTNIHIKLKI
jgi:hypothetical protein